MARLYASGRDYSLYCWLSKFIYIQICVLPVQRAVVSAVEQITRRSSRRLVGRARRHAGTKARMSIEHAGVLAVDQAVVPVVVSSVEYAVGQAVVPVVVSVVSVVTSVVGSAVVTRQATRSSSRRSSTQATRQAVTSGRLSRTLPSPLPRSVACSYGYQLPELC